MEIRATLRGAAAEIVMQSRALPPEAPGLFFRWAFHPAGHSLLQVITD